jgi:hypothetical protein
MKAYLSSRTRYAVALFFAALFAMLLPDSVKAQVVVGLPVNVNNSVVADLGNGPLELRIVQGNMLLATSQGSGIGSTSGASTTLTLTATPTTPPCVGCIISGAGITSGTTVAAFNGTTTITLSAAMTVAASTPLSWGAACPASLASFPVMPVQASVGGDIPLYTQARICAGAQSSPGAAILPFPIGAH